MRKSASKSGAEAAAAASPFDQSPHPYLHVCGPVVRKLNQATLAVKMEDLIQHNPLSFSTSKRALQRIGAALLKHNANWKDIKRGQPSRPDFFSPTRPCSLPLSGTNHLLLAVMQCQRGARVEREREMECRTGPTFHMLEGILHTMTVGRIGRKGARGETAMQRATHFSHAAHA